MSVITKTGDEGKSRWMGKAVDKDGVLLEAVGTIDELMAVLGIVMMRFRKKGKIIAGINRILFQINGELTGYGLLIDLDEEIIKIEEDIAVREKKLGPIHEFLAAGGELDVWLNWARTVARRAERRVVALGKKSKIDRNVLVYLNRLSDYLFILSRKV